MFSFLFEALLNGLFVFVRPSKRPNRFQRAIAHYTDGSIWRQIGVGALIGLTAAVAISGLLLGLVVGIVAIGEAIKG